MSNESVLEGPSSSIAIVEHKSALQALIAAQSEFPEIPKDRENTYFKTRYSTLDAILSCCRPILNRHGFLVNHITSKTDGLWIDTCQLTHVSEPEKPLTNSVPMHPDFETMPQQAKGSEITYSRRYSLAPLIGVTSDEDDDGNAASGKGEDGKQRTTGKRQQQKSADYKPKGGPPSDEKKPANPVAASQKAFVAANSPEDFAKLLARFEKSDMLRNDTAKFKEIFMFVGNHLEARVQKGEFKRDSPEVESLFTHLHAIGDVLDTVNQALDPKQGMF